MIKEMNRYDDIDEGHFIELADNAVDTIKKYGDYDWFVSQKGNGGE